MKGKLLKLEALRGFSALYVVLHHFAIFQKGKYLIFGFDLMSLFSFGGEAVLVFFVLSGFVIQYSYENSKDKSFKLFFMKRFLRIYIPLVCVMLLNTLMLAYQGTLMSSFKFGDFIGNLFMLQDTIVLKDNVICGPYLANSPLWSLSYEWWFYMVFFVVINKLKEKASAFIYIVSIIAAVSYIFYPFFINRIFLYIIIWWIGVEFARVYKAKGVIRFKDLLLPFSILLLDTIILRVALTLNHKNVTDIFAYPIVEYENLSSACLLVVFAMIWYKFRWFLFDYTVGLFKPLANVSFGIYISHWFLVSTATYLDFISNDLIRFFCYLLVCIVFSYLIERVVYVRLNKVIMGKIFDRGTNR